MNEGRGDFIRQVRSQRGRRTIDLKERNSVLVLPRMDAPYMHTFSFCSGSRAVIKRKKSSFVCCGRLVLEAVGVDLRVRSGCLRGEHRIGNRIGTPSRRKIRRGGHGGSPRRGTTAGDHGGGPRPGTTAGDHGGGPRRGDTPFLSIYTQLWQFKEFYDLTFRNGLGFVVNAALRSTPYIP